MQNPTVEELKNSSQYELIKVLRHHEIVSFVTEQAKTARVPMLFYYTTTILIFLFITAFSTYLILSSSIKPLNLTLYIAGGIFTGMILVIPFHEALHGLAYKAAGARKIKYGMDLSQLLFYAEAPGFVAGKYAFLIVALLPFTVINALFIITIIITESLSIQVATCSALLIHTVVCVGDFAMVNYLASYENYKVFTFDDPHTKTTFFYKEVKLPKNFTNPR